MHLSSGSGTSRAWRPLTSRLLRGGRGADFSTAGTHSAWGCQFFTNMYFMHSIEPADSTVKRQWSQYSREFRRRSVQTSCLSVMWYVFTRIDNKYTWPTGRQHIHRSARSLKAEHPRSTGDPHSAVLVVRPSTTPPNS